MKRQSEATKIEKREELYDMIIPHTDRVLRHEIIL
jgi:hypothetical protein